MVREGKLKGRTSAYAYFVQSQKEERKSRAPDVKIVFTEFSRECAQLWKQLSPEDRHRFDIMSADDKQRYDNEKNDYGPKAGTRSKRKKQMKDPNAPKRPLSAFFMFCGEERPKARAGMSGATIGDIAKELGNRWRNCTEEQKRKYESLAIGDKARYDSEMIAYNSGKRVKPESNPTVADDETDEEELEDDDDDSDDE